MLLTSTIKCNTHIYSHESKSWKITHKIVETIEEKQLGAQLQRMNHMADRLITKIYVSQRRRTKQTNKK